MIRPTTSPSVPDVRCGWSPVDRAAHATAEPAPARATAVAAPTPRLAPVTRAAFRFITRLRAERYGRPGFRLTFVGLWTGDVVGVLRYVRFQWRLSGTFWLRRRRRSQRVDVYSGVARLAKTVWASEVRAAGTRPTTAVMICHPTANFLGHYALPGSFCALRSPAEAPGRSLREASSMASLRCRSRRSAIRHDVQSPEGANGRCVSTRSATRRPTEWPR